MLNMLPKQKTASACCSEFYDFTYLHHTTFTIGVESSRIVLVVAAAIEQYIKSPYRDLSLSLINYASYSNPSRSQFRCAAPGSHVHTIPHLYRHEQAPARCQATHAQYDSRVSEVEYIEVKVEAKVE
jgi:hypothetical protein